MERSCFFKDVSFVCFFICISYITTIVWGFLGSCMFYLFLGISDLIFHAWLLIKFIVRVWVCNICL